MLTRREKETRETKSPKKCSHAFWRMTGPSTTCLLDMSLACTRQKGCRTRQFNVTGRATKCFTFQSRGITQSYSGTVTRRSRGAAEELGPINVAGRNLRLDTWRRCGEYLGLGKALPLLESKRMISELVGGQRNHQQHQVPSWYSISPKFDDGFNRNTHNFPRIICRILEISQPASIVVATIVDSQSECPCFITMGREPFENTTNLMRGFVQVCSLQCRG